MELVTELLADTIEIAIVPHAWRQRLPLPGGRQRLPLPLREPGRGVQLWYTPVELQPTFVLGSPRYVHCRYRDGRMMS